MNIEKVKQAVELQKQIITDMDVFGSTSRYNRQMLENLMDNLSEDEFDLGRELMDNHNQARTLTVEIKRYEYDSRRNLPGRTRSQ